MGYYSFVQKSLPCFVCHLQRKTFNVISIKPVTHIPLKSLTLVAPRENSLSFLETLSVILANVLT